MRALFTSVLSIFLIKCPPFDFFRICEARSLTRARKYVTLRTLRFGKFSLCSVCGPSECILCRRDKYLGVLPPLRKGFFYHAIENCAHSKRVRSTKIKHGPNFLLTLNCVCALYVPEIMRARHVYTSSIAQRVYARSAYGCLAHVLKLKGVVPMDWSSPS